MVQGLLRRTFDTLKSYNDILAHANKIAPLLMGETIKITLEACKKERYFVRGITPNNAAELYVGVGSQRIDLLSRYKNYGVTIRYPNIPCLKLECTSSKGIKDLPFELCNVML